MKQENAIAKNAAPHDPFTTILIGTVLLLFAAYFILPLYIMVINSMKPLEEMHRSSILDVPDAWTLAPWYTAWAAAKIGGSAAGLKPFFINSLLIAIPSVLVTTAVGALNGYILSKWRFRGSKIFYGLLLLSCLIPFQPLLIPMAHLLGLLGISQSIWGLVLVHVVYGIGFSTMFFRQYYQTIPDDIVLAAQLDGAGFFTIFTRILLPISGPIILISIIWQFMMVWNDYLFGASFAGPTSMPVTVALHNLAASSTGVKAYNVHLAAALLTALPTLIIYVLCGRYILRGLMLSVLKG